MSAHISPQVRMANEIAAQFRHLPAAEAAAVLAEHIRTFWEPRMTAELLRHAAGPGAGELDAVALAAARLLALRQH